MIWNTRLGTDKPEKAILMIAPRLGFSLSEMPSKKHREAQEKQLGFKWIIKGETEGKEG